ncbi:hypothetical protein GCM10017782_29220 [Deinococcus ficus]|nr:hypothetical protein GCM10017782_29220 [Deinococcus ficus]
MRGPAEKEGWAAWNLQKWVGSEGGEAKRTAPASQPDSEGFMKYISFLPLMRNQVYLCDVMTSLMSAVGVDTTESSLGAT